MYTESLERTLQALKFDVEGAITGARWYDSANGFARSLAITKGLRLETVAGIVSALSQRCEWKRNKRDTIATLNGEPAPGLSLRRDKADRILAGEDPETVLNGPKLVDFYHAIMGDRTRIVIDSHMIRLIDPDRKWITRNQYKRLQDIYREDVFPVMRGAGFLHPDRDLQAILWTVKRRHKL